MSINLIVYGHSMCGVGGELLRTSLLFEITIAICCLCKNDVVKKKKSDEVNMSNFFILESSSDAV